MKRFYKIILLYSLLLAPNGTLSAIDDNTAKIPVLMSIPPSACLSLAGTDTELSLNKVKGTAQVIRPSTVGQFWINYSSVTEGSSSNTICVNIVSGDIPAEIAIKLKIGPDAGAGMGKVGKPADPIYLSIFPQAIITNIGSCFTGVGPNKGHPLTYSWELSPNANIDLKSLENQNLEIGVIYTISSDQ